MNMYDCIIIGAGPAGIEASIYIKRANMDVAVFYKGISELEKVEKIDNYYGFKNGISGKELFESGIEQAKNLGIKIKKEEIINIEINEDLSFNIKSDKEIYKAKSVIIATGQKRIVPKINNIEKYLNKGVSFCALCDGYFYKDKDVVVIGNGKNAIEEAEILKNTAKNVKILTDGKEIDECDFDIIKKKIQSINGNDKVSSITFDDKSQIEIQGIFIAEGMAGGYEFAKRMGIITKDENIVVNEKMQTNIPGIFACGNITGGLLQVNKAVYEGAKAGINVINYVKISGK